MGQRFALCNKCITIEDEMRKAKTMREKLMCSHAKMHHNNYTRVERMAYLLRFLLLHFTDDDCVRVPTLILIVQSVQSWEFFRVTCAQDFGESMSMIVDGSDNQEYGLPYFCQVDKETSGGLKFKVKSF